MKRPARIRLGLTRLGHATTVVGIVATTLAVTGLTSLPAVAADTTSSSVTKLWSDSHTNVGDLNYDAFKNISITISQTRNLVNQGINVSWSGARPTSPGEYATDYFQVMQCWGDDPAGPSPQQCEFGTPASNVANLLGSGAGGRDLTLGEDPNQTYSSDLLRPPPRTNPHLVSYAFPFVSVKGEKNFDPTAFFTDATTNELSAVRTGSDGSGAAIFEVQTTLEAPQLGCGAPTTQTDGSQAPRSCWLVVVPRGEYNLDGSPANTASSGRISGSPLSASNWADRIVVKLGFQPVAQSCPIGNAERRVIGSEMIADAITSWQPALCATGTTYGYSEIGDGEARRQILSGIQGASGLAFVADPIDATTAGTTKIDYAPVAQSAIVVAFNIDYSSNSGTPAAPKNGTQVQSLTLNARLVAKLLTQSYQVDVPGLGLGDPIISHNPRGITVDPEFIALNPEFKDFTALAEPEGLLVALGNTDAAARVWQWFRADPYANAFLSGKPDEWGMRVNSQYLSLDLAADTTIDSFPKADLSAYRVSPAVPAPGFGTLDLRPYMNDMQEAAYRALKADGSVKTTWDDTKAPPAFVSDGPQLPGSRFMLALTDSTSADRYGLPVAKLVNAAGQAVAPSDDSIAAGIGAMVDSSVPGVKINDPNVRKLGAYPLSMLTYAAINVCAVPKAARADYAKLLGYAIGGGQVSGEAVGELPAGYVPLGDDFVKQTAATIKDLRVETSAKSTCDPAPAPVAPPPIVEQPLPIDSGAGAPLPTADPEEVVTERTKDQPIPVTRFGAVGALALGIPTLIAGPLLTRRGRRLARLAEGPIGGSNGRGGRRAANR